MSETERTYNTIRHTSIIQHLRCFNVYIIILCSIVVPYRTAGARFLISVCTPAQPTCIIIICTVVVADTRVYKK